MLSQANLIYFVVQVARYDKDFGIMRYPWRNDITRTNEGTRKLFSRGRTFGTQFLERNFNPESGGSFGKTGILPLNFDDQQGRQFQDFLKWSQDKGYARVGAKEWKEYAKSVGSVGTAGEKAAGMLKGFGAALLNIGTSMAISWGIQLIINGIDKLIVTADEAKESLNEFYSEVESGQEKLRGQKEFINSDDVKEWSKLSNGVGALGENVALTSEEFDKYNNITNTIAEQFPDLVEGWTTEGIAILKTKGSVEELTKAYEENRKAYYESLLVNAGDTFKNYDRDVNKRGFVSASIAAKVSNLEQFIYEQKFKGGHFVDGMISDFKSAKIKYDAEKIGNINYYSVSDKTSQNAVVTLYKDLVRQLNEETKKVKPLFSAYLETESLGYHTLSDESKNVVSKVINSFDYDFLKQFDGDFAKARDWVEDSLIQTLNELESNESFKLAFSDFINLDPNSMSEAEFEQAVKTFLDTFKDEDGNLKIDEELFVQLKLAFDIDEESERARDTAIKKLVNGGRRTSPKSIYGSRKELEQEFSRSEIDLLLNGKIDYAGKTIDEVRKLVDAFKELPPEVNASREQLEAYSKSLDNIQSAYQAVESAINEYNEQGYLSVDTFQQLMSLEPKYLNMLIDKNGNLDLSTDALYRNTAALIENMAVEQAKTLIDNVTKLSTEAEQLEYLTGVLDGNTEAIWRNVYALIAEQEKLYKTTNGEKGFSEQVVADTLARVEAIRKMSQSAISGIGKGGLSSSQTRQNAKKDAEERQRILDDLAEKEKKFAEDMAEAWKKEHLEQLKDGLNKQKDIIDRYKKNLETLDFGLEHIESDDFLNRADILTEKFDNLKTYGAAMRAEFERVASIIPQTGDEAAELANRMQELGTDMRSNITAIRETTIELQKVSIDMASTVANDRMGELQKELDNIDKYISILKSDYKEDYESASNVLFMDMLLPTYGDMDEKRREKQKSDKELIKTEQQTQDKINEIITKSLEMQAKENAEARAKERQRLIEDMEKARQDAKKKLAEAQADYVEHQNDNRKTTKEAIADIENTISSANLVLPEVDTSSLDRALTKVQGAADKIRLTVDSAIRDVEVAASTVDQRIGGGDDSSPMPKTTNPKGANVVETAKTQLGVPYVWGGESLEEGGFDCSGLMQWAYKQHGIDIPRVSQDQFKGGTAVDKNDLKPGDLVFRVSKGTTTAPGHVGMYIGNGQVLHSPRTGDVAKIINLSSWKDYCGARRYYAQGTSNAQNETAFVGDEYLFTGANHPTPELIFRKKSGTVELAGQNGVEAVQLNKGDAVLTYSKTKSILNKNKTIGKAYATGKPTNDPQIKQWINQASLATGVPATLLMAVMDQESEYIWYDSYPDNGGNASGFMMLHDKYAIADIRNQRGDAAANLAKTDKYQNILEGARVLKNHYDKLGHWADAASAYNQGLGDHIKYGRNDYGNKVWTRANSDEFKNAVSGGSSTTPTLPPLSVPTNFFIQGGISPLASMYAPTATPEPPVIPLNVVVKTSKDVLEEEYKKIQDAGLEEYLPQIKAGTLQTTFGNVDMNNRKSITWTEDSKTMFQYALNSWGHDPEINSTDTVLAQSGRYGTDLNGTGWEVAFTPITPEGMLFAKETLDEYINTILKEAYGEDGVVTEEELKAIDAEGRTIGEVLVKGVFAAIDESQEYANNGNWADTVKRLIEFAGDSGKIKSEIDNILDSISPESIEASYESFVDDISQVEKDIILETLKVQNDRNLSDEEKAKQLYDLKYEKGLEAAKIGEDLFSVLDTAFTSWVDAIKNGTAEWSTEVYTAFKDTLANISGLTYDLIDSAVESKHTEATESFETSSDYIEERIDYGDWDEGDSESKAWKRVYDRFKESYPKEKALTKEAKDNHVNAMVKEVDTYINERNEKDDWELQGENTETYVLYKLLWEIEEKFPERKNLTKDIKDRILQSKKKTAEKFINERNEKGDWNTYQLTESKVWKQFRDVLKAFNPEEVGLIKESNKNYLNAGLREANDWINERIEKDDWLIHGLSKQEALEKVLKWLETDFPDEMDKIKEFKWNIIDARWENSTNYINERNKYNDWALFDDSEIEAWERILTWTRRDYPDDIKKIREAEHNLFEARKREFSEANNFASTYLNSQKQLLQSHFNLENSITQARHENNKELEKSKTMYEYLDEETRQLLFNQNDYNVLNKKLNTIQTEGNRLQRQYEKDLRNSTAETVGSITNEYERQYRLLMKSYDIAKADLEIAKKKQKLNNVLNERNVRMFVNGSWQWVANTEDVINAQTELADAEYNKQKEQINLKQEKSINIISAREDELNVVLQSFQSGIISLAEAVGLAEDSLLKLPKSLHDMYSNASVDLNDTTARSFDGTWYQTGIDYTDKIYHATSLEEALQANAVRNAKIDGEGLQYFKISDDEIKKAWANGKPTWYNGIWYQKNTDYMDMIERAETLEDAYAYNLKRNAKIAGEGMSFSKLSDEEVKLIWEEAQKFYDYEKYVQIKLEPYTLADIPFDMNNLISNTMTVPDIVQNQNINQTNDNRIIINGITIDSEANDMQGFVNMVRRHVDNH